jgi:hypothetical protein
MAIEYLPIPEPYGVGPASWVKNFKTGWENWRLARLASQAQYYTSTIPRGRTFAQLVATIGDSTATIWVNSSVAITANLTVPENISIQVIQGGSFAISSGVTLTINGAFHAGLYQVFSGSGTAAFSTTSVCPTLFPEWWGAKADNSTDCTNPINACFAAGAGREILFSRGIYRCTGTLTAPQRNTTIRGTACSASALRHVPASFSNFIEIDTVGEGFLVIRDLEIKGSSYRTGNTKYLIYAESFNEGCVLENLDLRDSVGMIRVVSGYLSRIDIRCQASTWNAVGEAGISQAEWGEVYGPGDAPIWFGSMNACTVRVKTYRVGSIVTGGVTGESVMRIQASVACNLEALNFEWGLSNFDSFTDTNSYALRTQAILLVHAVIGQVQGMNIEGHRCENLVKQTGECIVNYGGVNDYQNYCTSSRFLNNSGHESIIGEYRAYDLRGPELFKNLDAGISAGQGWIVHSASIATGSRYTQSVANSGPNNDPENVLDTFAFSGNEKLGCKDGDARTTDVERRLAPRIITGYTVTASQITSVSQYSGSPAGSVGHYVQITPGAMVLENGRYVESKRGTGNWSVTGNQVVYRLRPVTASRWYRVFVGQAGQAYLVEYASDPVATPEGNWIAGFETNGSTEITNLASNPRLGLHGFYIPDQDYFVQNGTAAPASGYYRVGDMVRNVSPSTFSSFAWVCITAGSPGTWKSVDARDATLALQSSVDGNWDAITITNTDNEGTDDSVSIAAQLRGPDTTNNRNAGRLKFKKKLDYNGTANQDGEIILSPAINETNTDMVRVDADGMDLLVAGARIKFQEGPIIRAGSGTPEGAVTAPVGSMFLRSDGGAGTSLYIKESGSGNTGWVAK